MGDRLEIGDNRKRERCKFARERIKRRGKEGRKKG